MGLDRDDTIIRRRLRQKLEFLVEDSAAASAPSDAELQAWLDAHPESFKAEPQLAFRQVYLSPERRGPRRKGRRRGAARAPAEGRPGCRGRPSRRPLDAAGRGGARSPFAKSSAPSAPTSRRLCSPSRPGRGVARSSRPTASTSSSSASAWPLPSPRSPRSGHGRARVLAERRKRSSTRSTSACSRSTRSPSRCRSLCPRRPQRPAGAACGEAASRPRVRRRPRAVGRRPGAGPRSPPRLSRAAPDRSRDLVVPLEEADRRRGRDPDRAGDPARLPPRDAGPAAASRRAR